jgi:hypothetical protein
LFDGFPIILFLILGFFIGAFVLDAWRAFLCCIERAFEATLNIENGRVKKLLSREQKREISENVRHSPNTRRPHRSQRESFSASFFTLTEKTKSFSQP